MLSFKVYFLIGILGILSSCGFRPLYAGVENQAINQQLAHIQVLTIKNRIGQQVQNLLLDRLNSRGRPNKPLYTLNVDIQVNTEEFGLKFNEETTRAKLTLNARFFLIEISSGKYLVEGDVRSVNSYNISGSEFSRIASEADARGRAAREISDEIKTRLSLSFSQRNT
jgi:LPS-assembly lipoprotein